MPYERSIFSETRAPHQFQEAIAYAIYRKNPNWNRNASHFCQTDVIVEDIVLAVMKFLPRNRCHARELAVSTFPIFAYFGWTYFHLQKKYVTSQNLVWEKITYFLLIFPRGGKFIHLPATSQWEKWDISPPNPG